MVNNEASSKWYSSTFFLEVVISMLHRLLYPITSASPQTTSNQFRSGSPNTQDFNTGLSLFAALDSSHVGL